MSDFWSRKNIPPPSAEPTVTAQTLQIEATVQQSMEEMEAEHIQLVEDPEEDLSEVLNNANLRLEQGRLYQMIINHDIFGETDADAKAIKNVQREIRKFARERMEIMLGMRHESAKEEVISSPFNELEVIALKAIAAQMSKGVTKSPEKATLAPPKKDGISSISGTTKTKGVPQLTKEFKPLPNNRVAPAKEPAKSALVAQKSPAVPTDDTHLTKAIDQMTPDELAAYDVEREKRQHNLKAALPPNMVPMPSPTELEGMYMARHSTMMSAGNTPAAALMKIIGNR